MSPKTKCSPVYKVRSLKSSKILTNSGHKSTKKVDRNVDKKVGKSDLKLEMGQSDRLILTKGKVDNIIASFEDNIKKNESKEDSDTAVNVKVENAFKKLMESKGEMTPSPSTKKPKRLISVKPLGMKKLDGWLRQEK